MILMHEAAEQAVQQLLAAGVRRDRMSLIYDHRHGWSPDFSLCVDGEPVAHFALDLTLT
jgi:hypothetical protein